MSAIDAMTQSGLGARSLWRARVRSASLAMMLILTPASVFADAYSAQSLIIPMDTTYQDSGMLKAYGLVYHLLSNGIAVDWIIEPTKAQDGVDFTASAKNLKTGTSLGQASYRGGPFVIAAGNRQAALPFIQSWQTAHPSVVVHEAAADFAAPVGERLRAAPNLSVFADGNELIAFNYLNAAGIPASNGLGWPTAKDKNGIYPSHPDVLTEAEVSGPTSTNHADGALLDSSGQPRFCHMLSMHYGAKDHLPEVVAETRSYLQRPGTQYVGECQSATAFNNDALYGHFLTAGDIAADGQPATVFSARPASPYVQFHGTFGTTGGSEPSWSENSRYPTTEILLKGTGSAPGRQEVAFAGYLDGNPALGHALWIGGHQYTTNLPISANPRTQGVRIILNGLFASPCATAESQPRVEVTLEGASFTTSPVATYSVSFSNTGAWPAQETAVEYFIPAGASVTSTSPAATVSGGKVVWSLGSVAPGASGTLTVTVNLGAAGTSSHAAGSRYKVGVTPVTRASNTVTTVYYAGPSALVTDWVYTEPQGRITDGLAIAELDSFSPGRELLLLGAGRSGEGGRSIVLSTSDGAERSSFSPPAGRNVLGPALAAELSGGGANQCVAAESAGLVDNAAVFARTGSSAAIWASLPYAWPSYWCMGPLASDVASAPGPEVVVSDWYGNVRVLRGSDGVVQSSFNTWSTFGDHVYGSAAVDDLDGDGTPELVLAGYVKGLVVALNAEVAPDLTVQWSSASLKSLHGDALWASGPALGDIDGDGRKEIVVATTGATSDVYAFDVATPSGSACKHRWNPPGTHRYTSPVIGDVDASGQQSVIVISSTDSTVSVLRPGAPGCDSAGGQVVWQHQVRVGEGSEFTPVLFDFNGDGTLDVVAASFTRLEVIDVRNRVVMFTFDAPGARFSPSAVVGNADPTSLSAELYVSGWSNSKVYRLRLPSTATSATEWPTFMGANGRTGRR